MLNSNILYRIFKQRQVLKNNPLLSLFNKPLLCYSNFEVCNFESISNYVPINQSAKKLKFSFSIIIVFFLLSFTSIAQHTIVIDGFKSQALTLPDTLKRGDIFYVEIKNFNPLLYNFIVDSKDTVYASPKIPALIDGLSSTDFSSLISSITSTIFKSTEDRTDNSVKSTSDLGRSIASLDVEKAEPSLNQEQICLLNILSLAENNQFSNVDELKNYLIKLETGKDSICSFLIELKSIAQKDADLLKIANEAKALMTELHALQYSWEYENREMPPFDIVNYRKKINEYASFLKAKEKSIVELGKLELFKKAILKSFLSETKTFIKEKNNQIIHLNTILTFKKYNQIKAVYKNYKLLDSYTSFPIQINGDKKIVTIEVKPHDKNNTAPSYSTKLQIRAKKNWEFYTSTGFLVNNLSSHFYSSKQMENGQYMPVKEDAFGASIGINAMIHVATELSNDLYAQFGIGPTFTFEKPFLPGLAAGFGLLFGDDNKGAFTMGYNWSYVKRLSNTYTLNTETENVVETYTVDNLERGMFVSIGYTFW